MAKITDEQIIKLFREYEKQFMKSFKISCVEVGCKIVEKDLDENGIWDEVFCQVTDGEFTDNLIDNINNSIGAESYGIVNEESDDK